MMRVSLNTWVMLGLSVVGLGTFAYSLSQQTTLQVKMNHTMERINQSISETTPLVAKTVQTLSPLVTTTSALASIETSETNTVEDLQQMNASLRDIALHEIGILSAMTTLSQDTNHVLDGLQAVSANTDALLQKSNQASITADGESRSVGTLKQQTKTSVSELHQLNGKLGALRLLP